MMPLAIIRLHKLINNETLINNEVTFCMENNYITTYVFYLVIDSFSF